MCFSSEYSSKNCSIVIREQPSEGHATWTGPGLTRVSEGTDLTFTVDDIPRTMSYDVVVRYQTQSRGDWDVARITVLRPDEYDGTGPCGDHTHPSMEDRIPFRLPEGATNVVALTDVCLERGKVYKVRLSFERQHPQDSNPAAQILIDSLSILPRIEDTVILTGSPPAENRRREYIANDCNRTYYDIDYKTRASPECEELFKTVGIYVFDGAEPCNCDATGSMSKKCEEFGGYCQCKPNVFGRKCDKCVPGTYGFGPEGCKACDCNSIGAADNECDVITGQCKCHPNTYGRECDQCQTSFWNFPNCQRCECNGHTPRCDPRTGECLDCADYTSGYGCDQCIEGYYGNPLLGSEIGCRPCRCPNTVASNHTHADQCILDPHTNDMVCYCREGYAGARCDVCADNYYGTPEVPDEECKKCDCSNNVNLSQRGNCDLRTGQCLRCLYETAGDKCEYCRDGFFGDALAQDCRPCDCGDLGTNSTVQHCDRYTGQCPCLPNVSGIRCDQCIPDHWKIASGEGCEPCNCDSVGAEDNQCNPFDGQCRCRAGFGGRQCNECQANFWGNPNLECHRCECDRHGSETDQCDRQTGQCKCLPGMGGYKCDECARGYLGDAPHCSPCGECFDNWDLILNSLKEQTKRTIDEASEIKQIGATGAYTKEFNAMEKKLAQIRSLLDNTTISANDINGLESLENELRNHLNGSLTKLHESERTLENLHSSINLANVTLSDLRSRGDHIKSVANDLRNNSTQLQEANIEGALNLTRQAWQKADILTHLDVETQALSTNAERQCRSTESLLNRSSVEFDALQEQNENVLDQYLLDLQNLTAKIPDLNEQVCDRRGDPCDNLCGGAGCGQCGGLSCEKGALTRAGKALDYVKDAEKSIKEKEDVADDLIRSVCIRDCLQFQIEIK